MMRARQNYVAPQRHGRREEPRSYRYSPFQFLPTKSTSGFIPEQTPLKVSNRSSTGKKVGKFGDLDDSGSEREEQEEDLEELGERCEGGRVKAKTEAEEGKGWEDITFKRRQSSHQSRVGHNLDAPSEVPQDDDDPQMVLRTLCTSSHATDYKDAKIKLDPPSQSSLSRINYPEKKERTKKRARKAILIEPTPTPQVPKGVGIDTVITTTPQIDEEKNEGLSFEPNGETREIYVQGSKMVVRLTIKPLQYMDGSTAISQVIDEHVNLSLQYFLIPFLHHLTFPHANPLSSDFYLDDKPVVYRFQLVPHYLGNQYKRDRKTECLMWEDELVITPIVTQTA